MNPTTNTLLGQSLSQGRYTIVAKLGEGGMGEVYHARDANLETDVVIKIPLRSMLADPEFVRRFRDETRALVDLIHPHIVKITDVGSHDELTFAVMQYLAGGNLDDRLGGRRPQPPGTIPPWLTTVAEALDFVHSKGYIHRDVKPANILFDAQGYAYLSDFGVIKSAATASKTQAGMTGTGMVLGTAEYMAPELIMGEALDGRIDQYALGITVYEALCGRRPFESDAPTAVLVQQTTKQPPPLRVARPDLPEALCQAVHRALAKDPEERFPTCSGFARAVALAVGIGPGSDAARTSSPESEAEPLKFPCPSCGRNLSASAKFLGRKVRCPSCKHPHVFGPGEEKAFPIPVSSRGGTIALAVPATPTSGTTRPEIAPAPPTIKLTADRPPGIRDEPPQTPTKAPQPEERGPIGRNPLLIGGAAAACLLLAAGAFALRSGGDEGPTPTPIVPAAASLPDSPSQATETAEAAPGLGVADVPPFEFANAATGATPAARQPDPGPASFAFAPDPGDPIFPRVEEETVQGPDPRSIASTPDRQDIAQAAPQESPPTEPNLIRDVPINELLADPGRYAGSSVIPSGYFTISGPSIDRLPGGDYTAYMSAQPIGNVFPGGNAPDAAEPLKFVIDREIGEDMAKILAFRKKIYCVPRLEIRPTSEGNWVAAMVEMTIAIFQGFDSLYYLRSPGVKSSITPQDEVPVARLDPSGIYPDSVPGHYWIDRIGERTASNARTTVLNQAATYRAAINRQQINSLSQDVMRLGIEGGRQNQQGHQNLIREMFGRQ